MATQLTKTAGLSKKAPKAPSGDGLIEDAHKDPDVVRLATQEAAERSIERHAKVAAAAYFRAQQRGFEPEHELDDWLVAEAEIDNGALSVVVRAQAGVGEDHEH